MEARRRERERRMSLGSSLLWSAGMTILVLTVAVLLALVLDPRTKEWWTIRWNELAAFVRALAGR